MKKRTDYQILIADSGSLQTWQAFCWFSTSKGIEHAHRVALQNLRKAQPLTVNGTAAPYRLVILPPRNHANVKQWRRE